MFKMRFIGKVQLRDHNGNVIYEIDANHDKIYYDTMFKAMAISAKKNHDYAGTSDDSMSNFKRIESAGIDPKIGILVRILDKIGRIETFFKEGELKVENEGVSDAFIDVLNYCALMNVLLEEKNE